MLSSFRQSFKPLKKNSKISKFHPQVELLPIYLKKSQEETQHHQKDCRQQTARR